ncbi:MAG: TonB-dependent receptor [Treponema sp.]|jgi:vitamin B12 transporter|nr:TonB-dependent receptor [Treponema sp.]
MRPFLAFLLALTLLCPLFADETRDEIAVEESSDDYYDDEFLFMEDEEGITVTASPETTQQMKTITREHIDQLHPQDTAALLEAALDMPLVRYGGYGNDVSVTMRGFDTERVAILVDGVPINSRQSGEFNLSAIGVNAIDRIELVYGGSDSKYNVTGALGGVINIITTRKQDAGLRLSLNASNTSVIPSDDYKERSGAAGASHPEDLFDSQNLSVSAGFGAEQYSLSANLFTNRAANHFRYQDYYGIARRKDHNEVWDLGASLSFTRDLPQWATLIATGSVYYGDKNIPTSGTSSIAAQQTDFSTRQSLMLDAPRAFRDDLATEASLTYNWSRIGYELEPRPASHHNEHSLLAINRWNWYPQTGLTLNASGDYRYTYLDSTDSGRHDGYDAGLSLTAELEALERFLIIPSVKLAFNQSSEKRAELVPVPKLGLAWQVSDTFSLKHNYFRSFKFPDFDDLYWKGAGYSGNSELNSEDGWGVDLTAAYRTDTLGVESSVFAQWTTDSIHWSNDGRSWKPRNISEAAFFGIDSSVRITPPISVSLIKKLNVSVSYQFLLSYLLSGNLSFASDRRIPYMPMHTLGASLEFIGFKGGSLILSMHYESLRYTETQNITKLDPYILFNLTANQQIGENMSAFLVLRNIFDESYESMLAYPMPGFTITLGIRITKDFAQKRGNTEE